MVGVDRLEGGVLRLEADATVGVAVEGLDGGLVGGLVVAGEVGLTGDLRPVRGVLSIAVWARDAGARGLLIPTANVREAAVVSFKDKDGLDKPRAFVALQAGQARSDALAEELKRHVRESLQPFKAPREVVFLDALPRSDRGKVLKTELRQ